MAGTTKLATPTGPVGSDVQVMRIELNKAIDDIEVLRAGLAAAGAKINAMLAAADFTAMAALDDVVVTTYDAAGDMTAAKVADNNGVTT
jgi:hypothetical protein